MLTNKLRSEEQGNQGKEDCANKSEERDTTQGIHDIGKESLRISERERVEWL